MMNAAVVTSFREPPHYQPFPVPVPADGEVLADVLAAGLHPRVRSGAAGRHYTSSGTLPMIPGSRRRGTAARRQARLLRGRRRRPRHDGGQGARRPAPLGRAAGRRGRRHGRRRDEPGDVLVGRAAPPRPRFQPGQSVLVLGATGNAGAMAVQVARRLGAGRVVGAGRDAGRLRALIPAGADDVVQLTGDADATGEALAAAAAETDIVLDYLWGEPAQLAITALLTARVRPDPARSTGSRSARSPARRSSCRPRRCARPTSASRAAARARSRRAPTWPSCRRWWRRSPRARSGSGRPRPARRRGAGLGKNGNPRRAHRPGSVAWTPFGRRGRGRGGRR